MVSGAGLMREDRRASRVSNRNGSFESAFLHLYSSASICGLCFLPRLASPKAVLTTRRVSRPHQKQIDRSVALWPGAAEPKPPST